MVTKKKRIKSKLYELDMKQIQMLTEYGHDDKFLSGFFGVTYELWMDWKRRYPDFFDDMKKWRLVATERVEHALLERATGATKQTVVFEATGDHNMMMNMETEEIMAVPQFKKQVTVTKLPPDTPACRLWLINNSDDWQDKVEVNHDIKELAAAIGEGRKRALAEPVTIEMPTNGDAMIALFGGEDS